MAHMIMVLAIHTILISRTYMIMILSCTYLKMIMKFTIHYSNSLAILIHIIFRPFGRLFSFPFMFYTFPSMFYTLKLLPLIKQ